MEFYDDGDMFWSTPPPFSHVRHYDIQVSVVLFTHFTTNLHLIA
jgi:hypothetical protein